MLGLKLPTDPRWSDLVMMSLEDILTDHAYCEQKAASTCISFVLCFPEKEYLVDKLSPVVTEEWAHFRMVLDELRKRNLKFGVQRKDEYVHALMRFQKKGGSKDRQLLDRLLMSALIEARSCERFKILSEHLEDTTLKEFYRKLMIAEAQHYALFLDIAYHYFNKDIVRSRWEEWLNYEGEVIKQFELRGDRVH